MWDLISGLAQWALPWLPGGLWCAWWLFCVNWKKAWEVLADGGAIGVILLVFLSALAWAMIFPAETLNFWKQLAACASLALVALFCGWLQGQLGWTPEEVSFDPPEDHGHGHGHGHGHP